MATSNIENFDILTGRILGLLYMKFPMPITLGADQFIDFKKQPDSQKKFLRKVDFFMATANWLAESGYIRHSGVVGNSLHSAVLTSQGLLVLKAFPDSLEPKFTIGERLAKFGKEESKEAFRALVAEALGLGAKAISPMLGVTS
ncbi:hypothetical protein [Pseudomonas sp. 910_21]|uniref:hypothetical protein n=1 Tax=Pseudomonas sp. 910_21 TaxID=2604460 RepID=UPI004063C053